MTGTFPGSLDLRKLSGQHRGRKWWCLLTDFSYQDIDGRVYTAPAGTLTDFASIPRPLWAIWPPDGAYTEAAVIHDWLCEAKPLSSRQVHDLFKRMLEACACRRVTVLALWRAVRLGGPRFKAAS